MSVSKDILFAHQGPPSSEISLSCGCKIRIYHTPDKPGFRYPADYEVRTCSHGTEYTIDTEHEFTGTVT